MGIMYVSGYVCLSVCLYSFRVRLERTARPIVKATTALSAANPSKQAPEHLQGLQWKVAVLDSQTTNAFACMSREIRVVSCCSHFFFLLLLLGVFFSGASCVARAVPGGYICVNRGLLDLLADDDEALCGVMAHECAHVLLRHSAETVFQVVMSNSCSWPRRHLFHHHPSALGFF